MPDINLPEYGSAPWLLNQPITQINDAVDDLLDLTGTGRLSTSGITQSIQSNPVVSNLDVAVDGIEEALSTRLSASALATLSDQIASPVEPIIATHFLTTDEALRIAISVDGKNFDDTGIRWRPANPSTGDEAYVRDPSVIKYNGTFYITFTRPTKNGGGASGTINTIGLVKTTDFRTFTEMTPINVSGVSRVWAPQFFLDGTVVRIIVATSTSLTGGTFRHYELHATNTDLTAWSAMTRITSLPDGIDTSIIKDSAGVYHAFPVNLASGSQIEHWKANAILGPYTKVTNDNFQTVVPPSREGAQPVPLRNGGWRLYIDNFSALAAGGSIEYTDTLDFITWSPLRPVNMPMRHIGAITDPLAKDLRARQFEPKLRVSTAYGKFPPYWGSVYQPGMQLKEWVQIVSTTVGSGGTVLLAGATDLGFSAVDYIEAHAIGRTDVVEVCADIPSTGANAGVLLGTVISAAGTPVLVGQTIPIAWRVVGWGPVNQA